MTKKTEPPPIEGGGAAAMRNELEGFSDSRNDRPSQVQSVRFCRLPIGLASVDLSYPAYRIINVLAEHANADGECWPSLITIGTKARVAKKKVPGFLVELERWNLVQRVHRPAPMSTLYRINYQWEPGAESDAGSPSVGDYPSAQVVPQAGTTQSPVRGLSVVPLPGTRTKSIEQIQEQNLPSGGEGAADRIVDADEVEVPPPGADNPNDLFGHVEQGPSLKRALFNEGVAYLVKFGSTEGHARSMLGKWLSRFGAEATVDALNAAKAAEAIHPISYCMKVLEANHGKGSHHRLRHHGAGRRPSLDDELASFVAGDHHRG